MAEQAGEQTRVAMGWTQVTLRGVIILRGEGDRCISVNELDDTETNEDQRYDCLACP